MSAPCEKILRSFCIQKIKCYNLAMGAKKYLLKSEREYCQSYVKNKGVLWKVMQEKYPDEKNKRRLSALGSEKYRSSRAIRDYISELLDDKGLSLHKVAAKMGELMEAKKPIVFRNELLDAPDNAVQLETAKELIRMHGVKVGPAVSIQDNRQVIMNMSQDSVSELKKIVDDLKCLGKSQDYTENIIEYTQPIDSQQDTKQVT